MESKTESFANSNITGCMSQPKTKKSAAASAASVQASRVPAGSSLLDAPLDKMIADPWAAPARPAAATSAWGGPTNTVSAGQPDIWSARRSPSPGGVFSYTSLQPLIVLFVLMKFSYDIAELNFTSSLSSNY